MRLIILLLLFPLLVKADNPWDGIIDSSRATDWSTAGATITNRTTVHTNADVGATASQINSVIAQAGAANKVVLLTNGNFTFNDGISLKDNVTFRGAGANATKIKFTGVTSCNFGGDGGAAMCVWSGENNYAPVGVGASANWTAGYSLGATVVTLSSLTSLAVGDQIGLDQLDDSSDGWPAAGDIYICEACSGEGGNNFGRSGRSQIHFCRVLGISGSDVTISPPLIMPNWRSGRTPGAFWGLSPPITNVGIEDMSIDVSGVNGVPFLVHNAANIWIKGCRIIKTNVPPGSRWGYLRALHTDHITFKNNYCFGDATTGNGHYGIINEGSTASLFVNNIVVTNAGIWEHNGSGHGGVWAYNYAHGSQANAATEHNAGIAMNLYEGNIGSGITSDIYHGTAFFETFFRNAFIVPRASGAPAGDTVAWLCTYHRFFNFVGNVMGDNNQTTYERSNQSGGSHNEIWRLGDDLGFANVDPEARVKDTLFRWGNWDSVNDLETWSSSEVPSTLTTYANAVPASHDLPASFYITSQQPPDFWGTTYGQPPWPAIGPTVTGGDLQTNVWKNPARLVYDNLPVDSEYSLQGIKAFNETNYFAPTVSSTSVTNRPSLKLIRIKTKK
jgi:hypothetical protein